MSFTDALLSRRLGIAVGSLSLVTLVVTASLPALDGLSYAMSYAEGHREVGWTEQQANDFVWNAAIGALGLIALELAKEVRTVLGIFGVTALLVALQTLAQRQFPSSSEALPPRTPWLDQRSRD